MTLVVNLSLLRNVKARALRRASFLFLSALAFLLVACSSGQQPHVKVAGATMGTTYHVTVVAKDVDSKKLKDQIDSLLLDVNRQMSTYDPDSELMQLNRSAVGQPFNLSAELAFVLAESQRINADTNGAFDVTVGPLVNRWGFGPDAELPPPNSDEILALKERVGSQWLTLSDDSRQAIRKRDIFVDLSAIAKGFGVDQLANMLIDSGYQNFLVEIGGELRVRGLNASGEPWRVAIERPNLAPGTVQASVGISDMSVATSGSYRNFREIDGKRFSHTIDPVTGSPVDHNMVSVTVLASNCAEADALATAFSVMGPEASIDYAESNQLPIFILIMENGMLLEKWSSAFSKFLPSK